MDAPLASVIVPVYNVEAYLPQCVGSLRAQTYPRLEIVLVDDGSPDGSGRMCEEFAGLDPRVRVIHQENRGVSAARNAGLDAAGGDYVYFVDGDDWAAPSLVEESVSLMERDGYDACGWGHCLALENGGAAYAGRQRELLFRFPSAEDKRRFLCRWLLPCRLDWSVWSQAFRRDILRREGIRFAEEQKIGEDMDFSFRYLAGCRNLRYIPKPLYFYRQRGSSVMHSADLGALGADILRMVRRLDGTMTGRGLPGPFYVYGGMALAVFLGYLEEGRTAEEMLEQAAAYFRATEDWEYLREQARLAAGDRALIRRVCGLRMGEQVNGFFRYVLTGDPAAYRRAERMQQYFLTLRGWKDRLRRQGGSA